MSFNDIQFFIGNLLLLTIGILFGGDQLTAARAWSAKRNVANGDSDSVKLLGLIPVAKDWHTKMSLLSVGIYIFENL